MSSRTRTIKDILWVLALSGLIAAVFRLWFGLGATTNLSDAYPWGLWKILNMIGGVALSTSGFTVGFLVYVLRIKRFQPLMKPAILIAFLGYGCSCAALLLDIGLPQRFWHPIFMWNINSFLFEVFWCVMLYFTVTAIELAPMIFERLRAEKIAHFLHHIAIVVVIIGISLSSLHHSSLGSLFLVTPQRLYPLWYTPWLPWLFIISAMGAGLMVVVLIRMLWAYWYDHDTVFGPRANHTTPLIRISNDSTTAVPARGPEGPEMPALRSLATIAAWLLGLYLVFKVVDLFLHGGWSTLMVGNWESWLYLIELTLTAILPVILMILPWSRRTPAGVAVAATSAAVGLALNRVDVGILGYVHDAGVLYFPTLVEWMVGLGVVAAAGLVLFFLAENMPVFGPGSTETSSPVGKFKLPNGSLSRLWSTTLADSLHRVTLIAVFIIPLAYVLMYPPYGETWAQPIRPADGLDAERATLCIDGNKDGVETIFAHAEHQHRFGDSASCVKCHHLSMPGDHSTPCSRCHCSMNDPTNIFSHDVHTAALVKVKHLGGLHPENFTCQDCHAPGSPRTAATAKNCMECHRENMVPPGAVEQSNNLLMACSYREAMHGTCIKCHQHEAIQLDQPHLSDCQTCHQTLRPRETTVQTLASQADRTAN